MRPLSPALPADLLPLIQAPMAGVQGLRLALAVSRAGALGSVPAAMLEATALDALLQQWQQAGRPPLNLNFFCHPQPTVDLAAETAWLTLLRPYAEATGVPLPAAGAPPSRRPFDAEMATLVERHRPPVVSFHFGLPAPELLARVKRAGCSVLSSATTVDEGRWLVAHGADAVIAQGLEAGGHRGHFLIDGPQPPGPAALSAHLARQAPLAQLLPALRAALDVPLVAAGGLSDADDLRGAFAAGADGVQLGTAFLRCDECDTSALHRAALAERPPRPTVLTRLFSGRPARGMLNRLLHELDPLHPAAPAFPLASTALAPLRAAAEAAGRDDFSPLWAGTGFAACRAVPVATLIDGWRAVLEAGRAAAAGDPAAQVAPPAAPHPAGQPAGQRPR
ncbi:MAG: hypothetical protein RIQ53_4041 [Pseudomonadota bacterium]|jgi:nitronate monooxygenase